MADNDRREVVGVDTNLSNESNVSCNTDTELQSPELPLLPIIDLGRKSQGLDFRIKNRLREKELIEDDVPELVEHEDSSDEKSDGTK